MKKTKIDHYTDKEALEFHSHKKPGKIEIVSSKTMTTKRDLAIATRLLCPPDIFSGNLSLS